MSSSLLGFAGVLGSVLAFGSFGVPIKSAAVVSAKVDPLIFQCYKSAACFTTCWLVLLYTPLKFTAWGIAGAAIWVVNGIAAIMAIQRAGLALSQCLWSAISIFVGFAWGAAVFEEPVSSIPMALAGLTLMAVGMAGVGYAANGGAMSGGARVSGLRVDADDAAVPHVSEHFMVPSLPKLDAGPTGRVAAGHPDEESERLVVAEKLSLSAKPAVSGSTDMGQWTTGVLLAIYVGVANGSFMVPLKYAHEEVQGVEYLVSFGVGSVLVTLVLMSAYFHTLRWLGRPVPSFQADVAAVPALTTGLLWSLGNFCSILATQYLGMAVGWPLVQCQLIVSSMWGIFYYKEVTGLRSTLLFMASTGVILIGVAVLAWYGRP